MNWYYRDGDQQVGPVADEAMRALIRAGAITAETPVWKEGQVDWVTLAQTELGTLPPMPQAVSAPSRRFTWKVLVPVVGVVVALLALLIWWLHGRTDQGTNSMESLCRAADRGDATAQCNLGNCYYNGHGVPMDKAEAVKWYHKAADQGLADAQGHLGICYHFGDGVPMDKAEAVKWCHKAAEQGYAAAQSELDKLR